MPSILRLLVSQCKYHLPISFTQVDNLDSFIPSPSSFWVGLDNLLHQILLLLHEAIPLQSLGLSNHDIQLNMFLGPL